MDDLTKSLVRDMIREELRAQLPAAVEGALKALALPQGPEGPAGPRGKRGLRGERGPEADLTPLREELDRRMAAAEAQVLNLVNAAESRVSAHLAAAFMVKEGEG